MPSAHDLDALPDADIASTEGMSNDQLFRSRLQFALEQNRALFNQVQFADAKAGTLLALIGLLAAHVASGGMGAMAVWEMRGLLVLDGAVIALCVAALTPRTPSSALRKTMARTDRYSWPSLATDAHDAEAHAAFLRTAQASQLVVAVARANAATARIISVKYALLGWAFGLAFIDVIATLLVAGLG